LREEPENARYARALHHILFTEKTTLENAAIGERAAGDVMELAGGYAHMAEIDASRGLLLSLLQGQGIRKLRQDVRNAEICVALVGHLLREIPKSLQRK